MTASTRPRVAILTNILTPYRLPVYQEIAQRFETLVFVSGHERNRTRWAGIEAEYPEIELRRTRGLMLRARTGRGGGYDERYLHLPLGQLLDLYRARPAAVITVEMGLRTLLALLYGTLTRTPVWVWWGGTLRTERRRILPRRLLRRLIARWAPRWISYGLTSTEYLLTLGIPAERILQIQNCVDERPFRAPTAPAERVEPRPVFLYTGQLIGRKGVDRFLEAAAILQRQGRVLSILIVGDGPQEKELKALAEQLGLANVHFRPGRTPREMPGIYRSGDFLVFPTREDVWGLVVNEAMWSGVPVLASIHAGCAPELLSSEQTFDPDELQGFAAVLRRALDGEIPPPDTSALRTCREVGGRISADLHRVLETRKTVA